MGLEINARTVRMVIKAKDEGQIKSLTNPRIIYYIGRE